MITNEGTKRDVGSASADMIGKVFAVCSRGLRECLVCGELFTRTTARAHAEANCYPLVELCLMEREGGKHVTD